MPPWDSEHSSPAWSAEFSEPSPQDEQAPTPPEEPSQSAPAEEQPQSRGQRFKRMPRVVAAAVAVGGVVMTAAPEPMDVVDITSYIEIECCVVTPEEPEVLHFRYMDYRSLYEDVPTYSEDEFSFYLVDPEGQETELTRRKDPVLYRPVYCAEAEDVRDAAYSATETAGTYFNLNTGCEMWCADIGPFEPGSLLKIVCAYESDGVIQRMTTSQQIVRMPEPMEPTVTVQVTPRQDGIDEVAFYGSLHPQPGHESEYVFENQAFSRMSFCTRWYDEAGVYLGKGWCFAAPTSVQWPFPDVYMNGNDYVFLYQGPVRREAPDTAAAYYTLELMIYEESTGWPYLLESDPIPIRFVPVPKTTATPEPIPTEAPPLKRDLMIESGKDAMDFPFLLVNSDWVLTEAADSYVLSDPGGQERMMLFSMDVGFSFTADDLDGVLLSRYRQEAEANAASGLQTTLVSERPYACLVNGYPGRALDFELLANDQLYGCKYVFWGVGTRLYGPNLLAPGNAYEHTCTVMDELLSSFTPAS